MGKINVGRVIGGGLLAGLVINVCEYLVNGLWLARDWEEAMKALGKSGATGAAQMTIYVVWGFIMGVFAVWLYSAIRPRFGAGPKTAVIAAVAAWLPGYVLSMIPPAVMGMFPARLMLIGVAVGLIESILATQIGAYIYQEGSAASATAAAGN
jgi:uncharacterized membrane protein